MIHLKAILSFQEAQKILGLSGSFTPEDLKKAYRDSSKKAHPDMGGSTSDMQKVNEAYEILQKQGSGNSSMPSWDERNKRNKSVGEIISKELLSKFKANMFNEYLDKLSGKKFSYVILKTFPLDTDRSPSYAGFVVEFATPERDEVFSIQFTASISSVIMTTKSLGGGNDDMSYNISILSYAYTNNRKQKIFARDWSSTNRHTVLTDPTNIWPIARMKKLFAGTGKIVYKKADMLNFLKNKLGAIVYGDYMGVTLPDNNIMMLERWVFKGRSSWSINDVYNNVNGKPKDRIIKFAKGVYFSEDEESALKLLKAVKKIELAQDAEKELHVEFPPIN